MDTYIYTYTTTRAGVRTFTVYRVKRNTPDYLGNFKVQTASYSGDASSVRAFIAKQTNSTRTVRVHGV